LSIPRTISKAVNTKRALKISGVKSVSMQGCFHRHF
jgi:hypothetical protein